jgi:UDP-N-acetylmuramoyl-L-alanyl-D-glutamate--2,6-diaminopimelate ligase
MPTQEAAGTTSRYAAPLVELAARALDEPGVLIDPPGSPVLVRQVTDDSREVARGTCFVAIRGLHVDGAQFVPAAIARGAAAIVSEQPRPIAIKDIAWVQVGDARRALARMAAVQTGLADVNWSDGLQQPRLRVAGVTGTNGKSTICHLVHQLWRQNAITAASLGTIQYDLVHRRLDAPMTTPSAPQLVSHLAEAARAGATHAVMEVSSHALDQRRADGVRFDVGVFTNLTGDHRDYHETEEAYRQAKKRLFDGLGEQATAVINVDDPNGEAMVADCRARVVRYGLTRDADIRGEVRSSTAGGTEFLVHAEGEVFSLHMPLVGRHNVLNALAAAAVVRALGMSWSAISAGLASVTTARGRLEPVLLPDHAPPPFRVFVDYAHTDDALENVLSALRPLATKRLIVLFGCGGDRDRTKRPRMAAVAQRWADHIVITSDNPRTEVPDAIIADILTGLDATKRSAVVVEPDRGTAIGAALAAAQAGDVVVLAGKGHETYQEINGQRSHFDDAEVAAAWLTEHVARAAGSE